MGESILYLLGYLPFRSYLKIPTSIWCISHHLLAFLSRRCALWQIVLVFFHPKCILPSLLKHRFAGYRILGWQVFCFVLFVHLFSFEPFKNIVYSPLASKISDEKSVIIQFIVPLYVKCCFPQVAFSIVPLSLVFSNLTMYVPRSIFIIFILLGVC